MKSAACCALFVLAHAAWGQFDNDIASIDDLLKDARSSAFQIADEEPRASRRANLFDDSLLTGSDDDADEAITAAISPSRCTRRASGEDHESEYIGRLSANPFAPDSTSNVFSEAGSPYSSKSINNPYGKYGSEYSTKSARNPYATDAPKLVAQDGQYLGRLSDNPYDPDSTANPDGRYGSPYSPTSINNPYSKYGSPYSPDSPNNPYTTTAPLLFGD